MSTDVNRIYRHLVVEGKDIEVEKVRLTYSEALTKRMQRVMCKTIEQVDVEARSKSRMEFEAYLLRPKFNLLVKEYELKWRKSFLLFTNEQWEEVEKQFMKTYMKEM